MGNVKTKMTRFCMLVLSSFLILGIQSCNKYDEGPNISLRTRTERVANTWKVENYKVNDEDLTSLVTNYQETFTKAGNYSYKWGLFEGNGNWSFQNRDLEIKLVGTDNQSSHTLFILKLEEMSFWYYYIDGDSKHELHLVPN